MGITGRPSHAVKTKSSKYFGVIRIINTEKWKAQICKNGKQIYGGSFDDEIDAAKAVNQLCEENGLSQKNTDITGKPSHGPNTKRKGTKARSKYSGVSWHKATKKWIARISKDGKQFCGGYFDDEIDAAKAANKLYEKYRILPKNPNITGEPSYVPKKKEKSSKYFGVSWHKIKGKWIARIRKDGKKIYGGYFDDEVDAATAVNQLCEKYEILPKNPDINEAHINGSANADQRKYRNKRKRSEENIIDEDEENCLSVNMFLKKHILPHSESFSNDSKI